MLVVTAFKSLTARFIHHIGNDIMRIDIYRRAEHDGKFSYLAVPESKDIPEEATNTDWEVAQRAFEVNDTPTTCRISRSST